MLLDQVGFYEVVGGGTTELVAVNFDPRESDLTPIDAATLERWRGLGVRPGEAATPVAVTAAGETRAELAGAVARDLVADAGRRGIRGRKLAS